MIDNKVLAFGVLALLVIGGMFATNFLVVNSENGITGAPVLAPKNLVSKGEQSKEGFVVEQSKGDVVNVSLPQPLKQGASTWTWENCACQYTLDTFTHYSLNNVEYSLSAITDNTVRLHIQAHLPGVGVPIYTLNKGEVFNTDYGSFLYNRRNGNLVCDDTLGDFGPVISYQEGILLFAPLNRCVSQGDKVENCPVLRPLFTYERDVNLRRVDF